MVVTFLNTISGGITVVHVERKTHENFIKPEILRLF
jgi:hypothetical protein